MAIQFETVNVFLITVSNRSQKANTCTSYNTILLRAVGPLAFKRSFYEMTSCCG